MINNFDRCYSELIKFKTYGERLEYLCLYDEDHLSPRSLDYDFYHNPYWRKVRKSIIRRDLGCDLGVPGMDIMSRILVHHINPLTPEDLDEWNVEKLFNPENLITVTEGTHNSIHYRPKQNDFIERAPGDTKLW